MLIGCMRLTDVSFIDTIRSHENCEKVWGWASCTELTAQVKDFVLILTLKISPVRDRRSTPTYCQLQSHVTQKLGQK